MRKFSVDIPHSLQTPDVRARLERAKTKLEEEYGANVAWENDTTMTVTRKGLDARVSIAADHVHVDVELGFLLVPMAGAIKESITKRLTTLFTG